MSEFKEPSALMKFIRCRRCFQALSPVKVRCPRCGKSDHIRVYTAIAHLLLGAAVVGMTGIVLLAVLGPHN
jgi:hypothetical protein